MEASVLLAEVGAQAAQRRDLVDPVSTEGSTVTIYTTQSVTNQLILTCTYQSLWKTHRRATKRHRPYRITLTFWSIFKQNREKGKSLAVQCAKYYQNCLQMGGVGGRTDTKTNASDFIICPMTCCSNGGCSKQQLTCVVSSLINRCVIHWYRWRRHKSSAPSPWWWYWSWCRRLQHTTSTTTTTTTTTTTAIAQLPADSPIVADSSMR